MDEATNEAMEEEARRDERYLDSPELAAAIRRDEEEEQRIEAYYRAKFARERATKNPNGLGTPSRKTRKPMFRRLRAFLAYQLATLLIFGWCRRKPVAWWLDLAARNDRAARAFTAGPLPPPLEAMRGRFLEAASDARRMASAIRVEAEENLAVLE